MNQSPDKKERFYEILVFGIEKKGLTAPKVEIRTRNFGLHFESYTTHRRFNEFDGVILFQRIFEQYEWKNGYGGLYVRHTYDKDALDKRKKEADLLLGGGGFICFVLNEPFLDKHREENFRGTDLAKFHLNYPHFYRENFSNRIAQLHVKLDEFRRFLDIYGAANSHFHHYNENIEWRVIAEAAGRVVGMILERVGYFIPSLIPDNRPEVVEEYFTLLADAIISTHNKFHQELPSWIDEFKFNEEEVLEQERIELQERLGVIAQRIEQFKRYKSILAYTGDELVAAVVLVFNEGFGIRVDPTDELREDFTLTDDQKKPICLCEVKGTNKGVKRENINQADSHRERSGLSSTFPTLLIANINIKGARNIKEKDHKIAQEQIIHAKKMNVLILRTIDLLWLLWLYLDDKIKLEELRLLLTRHTGWLRVDKNGYVVITGEKGVPDA